MGKHLETLAVPDKIFNEYEEIDITVETNKISNDTVIVALFVHRQDDVECNKK